MSCGTGGQAGLSARSGYAKSKQTGEPELRLSAPAQGRGGREGAEARPEPPGSGTASLGEPPRPAPGQVSNTLLPAPAPTGKGVRSDTPTREISAQRKGIKLLWSRSCHAERCTSWSDISHSHGCSPAQARGVFVPSQAAVGPSGGSRRPRSPRSQSTSSCSAHPGCKGRDGRCPPCSKEGHRVSSPGRVVPPPCPALPVALLLPGPPKTHHWNLPTLHKGSSPAQRCIPGDGPARTASLELWGEVGDCLQLGEHPNTQS